MKQQQQRRHLTVPHVDAVKFIERSNGTIKGYSVNTFHGMAKNYNEDRVSIIMNITKPNYKGRWPRCSYFGIFDGHGGNKCSDFLKENMHKFITENAHFPHQPIQALKFGFKKAEQQFLNFAQAQNPLQRSGSCAIVLLIIDETCYVANVGDSRAILSTNSGKQVYSISKDHKPDSQTQKQRILSAGGKIYQSAVKQKNGQTLLGPFRIEPGKLSVSRSFGDIEAKLQKYEGNPKVLIAKPEITYFQINPDQHDFIIMGSDGIYDKLTNEQVVECFWKQQKESFKNKDAKHNYGFIGSVPSKIIERSMEKYSLDNLTSLLIVFQDQGRLLLPQKTSLKMGVDHQIQLSTRQQKRNQLNLPTSNQNENKNRNNYANLPKQKEQPKSEKEKKSHSQEMNKGNAALESNPVIKRKNSNIIANIDRKMQESGKFNNIGSGNSLNSSVSTKNLIYNSVKTPKMTAKQETGKINLNEVLQKKKSYDFIRKQKKDSLWKQLSTIKQRPASDKLQKIRS